MYASDKFKLLLEEHSRKLLQLKKTIIFYEEKKCMFSSFNNLYIDYDDNSVFSDRKRCGKLLHITVPRRITPKNVPY